MKSSKKILTAKSVNELLDTLKLRFEKNMSRHRDLEWSEVAARLKGRNAECWSLNEMEASGGEPDLVGLDKNTGQLVFYDCAAESPGGRRSICYDHEALEARKEHKPADSAVQMAANMGIELLTQEQYHELQQLGNFDLKTSSWIKTPQAVRKLGGALFCDRRYNHVFVYHNGAESYYAGRGFRGMLKI